MELDAEWHRGVLAAVRRPADQQPVRGRRVEDGAGHEGRVRQSRGGEDGEGDGGVRCGQRRLWRSR